MLSWPRRARSLQRSAWTGKRKILRRFVRSGDVSPGNSKVAIDMFGFAAEV
jgi:hypothetical protein